MNWKLGSVGSVKVILTLQGVGVDEVDGAGNTGAYTDLTHVPKALGQPR